MHIADFGVMEVGIIAVLVGTVVLVAMVRYDLGPSSRLAMGRQWLLATALGTGIVAFAFKLLLIVAVVNAPEIMVEPLIAREPLPPSEHVVDPLQGIMDSQRFVWVALSGQADSASRQRDALPTYIWEALPEVAPTPSDNPTTPEKVALGEQLFFDKSLSRDGTLACASCHAVPGSGADGRPTSLGIDGQTGSRNAPTVWNAAFQSVLFWDGRAKSLEDQAKGPLVNPLEMGMPSHTEVERRVRQNPAYREAFAAAFGAVAKITIDRIAQAIAAYERTLITPDTPYDRFVRGDLDALGPAEVRGMGLFQSVGCVICHAGPNFSVASVFDPRAPIRVFPLYPTPYEARYGLTEDVGGAPAGSGRGSWRVPSLRNVAATGPWFHNGSVNDLTEAVRIMSSVQLGYTGRYRVWSERNRTFFELDRPKLSEQEIADLVAFLHALTSDRLRAPG